MWNGRNFRRQNRIKIEWNKKFLIKIIKRISKFKRRIVGNEYAIYLTIASIGNAWRWKRENCIALNWNWERIWTKSRGILIIKGLNPDLRIIIT